MTGRTDVIVSERTLIVGQAYVNHVINGPYRVPRPTSFVVVRETDESAYRACLRRYGCADDTPFFYPVTFYEILTD